MKVRLYSLAALAATALATQGVAQQNDAGLERALAELNAGLTAPSAQGGVSISGDFRVRNRWADDGEDTNNRDLDTRARLNFDFRPTESSRAFVGFSGREAFGGSVVGRHDAGSMGGGFVGEGLDRAWVEVDSLVGEGGTVRAGRGYYTLGHGRLLGSEEWDNLVTTFSGIWYSHPAAGFHFHGAMLNGVENGTGVGGDVIDESDNMIYVAGLNWSCDMVEACGTVGVAPWFIRDETASAGATATHETWYGVDVDGALMGFGYDFDFARYEFDAFEGDAWYVGLGVELEQLESVPMIQGGGINIAVSQSDEEFAIPGMSSGAPYGTLYHDVVGFADLLGPAGIWTPDTDTWRVGVGISPSEGWDGGLALMNIETAGVEYDELDVSLGTQLNGNVGTWFGYAWIEPDGGADNMSVFWATFELAFGGN